MKYKKRIKAKREMREEGIQFKSGLEINLALALRENGHDVLYETETIEYIWPEEKSRYKPDFRINRKDKTFFLVEAKGIFDLRDRKKHLLIKNQHPEVEIRFVFHDPHKTISKKSKTSYADWCVKHGFRFAHRRIPTEWFNE